MSFTGIVKRERLIEYKRGSDSINFIQKGNSITQTDTFVTIAMCSSIYSADGNRFQVSRLTK